jgi:hypothetical protein
VDGCALRIQGPLQEAYDGPCVAKIGTGSSRYLRAIAIGGASRERRCVRGPLLGLDRGSGSADTCRMAKKHEPPIYKFAFLAMPGMTNRPASSYTKEQGSRLGILRYRESEQSTKLHRQPVGLTIGDLDAFAYVLFSCHGIGRLDDRIGVR